MIEKAGIGTHKLLSEYVLVMQRKKDKEAVKVA